MSLSEDHKKYLAAHAVDVELAERLGVRSLLSHDDNPQEGMWPNFANHPAILFPWTSPKNLASVRTGYQVRPDNPTRDEKTKKPRKYVFSKGEGSILWEVAPIIDSTTDVLVVEGTKQCLAAASNLPDGTAVYGIAGCRNWHIDDLKALAGYRVTVVLDADAATNPEVYDAGEALDKALRDANAADVLFARLEPPEGNPKAGLDDVLVLIEDEADRVRFLERAIKGAKAAPADERPKDGGEDEEGSEVSPSEPESCWVDPGPYLDGTYVPPQPEVGARRPDGRALLYRAKAHTLVAETGVGKSWFGLVHVAAELLAGNTVVYAHFEEPNMAPTLSRLQRLGVPADVIRSGLKWLDVDKAKLYRKALKALDQPPSLVILDGVVAACGGKPINEDETVNWFRGAYVLPATKLGAAVLALHHPVKDPGRRGERGGRGSGSWINLVDGVHFQGMPGKTWISKGRKGSLDIYADKDREASVVDGAPDGPHGGWRAVTTLWVEDVDGKVEAALTAPVAAEPGQPSNEIGELADQIVFTLENNGGRYPTVNVLQDKLRARKVKFRASDLGPALELLEAQGRLERAPYVERKARPGWLVEPGSQGRESGGE